MERGCDAIDVRRVCELMAVDTRGDAVLEARAGERIRSFAFALQGIIDREARRRAVHCECAPNAT